jgi:hypothetical protein
MLQASEAYLIMTTLLLLPGMIALSYLALSGRFERIEDVKFMAVIGDDCADEEQHAERDDHAPSPPVGTVQRGCRA